MWYSYFNRSTKYTKKQIIALLNNILRVLFISYFIAVLYDVNTRLFFNAKTMKIVLSEIT